MTQKSLRPARSGSLESGKERLLRVLDPGPGTRLGRGGVAGAGVVGSREGKGDAESLRRRTRTVLNPEKKDFCGFWIREEAGAGRGSRERGKGGAGVVGSREGMEGRSDTKLEGSMDGKVTEKKTFVVFG